MAEPEEPFAADTLVNVPLHGIDIVLLLALLRNDPILHNQVVYALWQQRITEIVATLTQHLPEGLLHVEDLFEDEDDP